jgi:hypothetical protein
MKKSYMNIFFTAGVGTLLLLSSCASGILRISQSNTTNDSLQETTEANDNAIITTYISGVPHSQVISYESGTYLKELFSELALANAHDPCSAETQRLQQQILLFAEEHGLLPVGMSADMVFAQLGKRRQSLAPQSIGGGSSVYPAGIGREMFCNFVATGEGAAFPIIILPRFIPFIMAPIPRLFVGWKTPLGLTSCGGLLSGTGFYAVGPQQGFALGFWGIGFSIFLPPVMAYGMFGYALFAKASAEYMEYYPPNHPPEITQTDPANGEQMVPIATTELRFDINDPDNDLMSYTVTTDPDIGSGSGGLKPSGTYSIPVSGLEDLTKYTWHVEVTDGKDTTEKTMTFTTEAVAPILTNPSPADGERDVPMDLPQLQFTLKDYQGDTMEYTVQTAPNIGSQHETGVHDGTYTVPVSGMTYGATYRWYVNVTDGSHWTRKLLSFETGYPSQFDPFDYGWHYRKQITIDHTQVLDDLAHFPVLISTTDTDLSQKAQADGGDIMFMNDIGVSTRVHHDLESFTSSSGSLIAWVDIPAVSSSTDTVFYMYYGNPYCINQAYPEKTWDAGYQGIWHLIESIGTRYDSTIHHKDCTASGTTHTNSAKIGGGEIFNERADSIYTNTNIDSMSTFTIECLFAFDSTVGKTCDEPFSIPSNRPAVIRYSDNRLQVWVDGHNQIITSLHTFGDTDWHYVVLVATGSQLYLYVDSILEGSVSWAGSSGTSKFFIGDNGINTDSFSGTIDEARISDIARSPSWINTGYNSINNPTQFLGIGPEVQGP